MAVRCQLCVAGVRVWPQTLLLLFVVTLLMFEESKLTPLVRALTSSVEPSQARAPPSRPHLSARALLEQCEVTRPLGLAGYRALPGAVQRTGHEPDGACVAVASAPHGPNDLPFPADARGVHCCVVHVSYKGRAGNAIVQYASARVYSELHSCAQGLDVHVSALGADNPRMTTSVSSDFTAWPPAGGEEAYWRPRLKAKPNPKLNFLLHNEDFDQLGIPGVDSKYMQFFATNELTPWVRIMTFFEEVDMIYAGLSLAWDLGGETLVGSGIVGLAPLVLSRDETVKRSLRWAVQREACAAAGVAAGKEALVLEERIAAAEAVAGEDATRGASALEKNYEDRAAAAWLRAASFNATKKAVNVWTPEPYRIESEALLQGTAAFVEDDIKDFIRDPERTVVIHIRLGDQWAGTERSMAQRRLVGHNRHLGASDWGWVLEFAPNNPKAMPEMISSVVLRQLETSAASIYGMPPLSFYTSILDATRGTWDRVLIVTETLGLSHPVVQALIEKYDAFVHIDTIERAMSLLILARTVILSPSTFSFVAAALGRARVIHAPYVGPFWFNSANSQCLLPCSGLDPRWVFHDVFRGAVDKVHRDFVAQTAAVLKRDPAATVDFEETRGTAPDDGIPMWRVHPLWPLPVRPPTCPRSVADKLGSMLAFARGEEGPYTSSVVEYDDGDMPVYFLSFDQLAGFHRRLDCNEFYAPGRARYIHEASSRGEAAAVADKAANRVPLCVDRLHLLGDKC